MKEVVGAGSGDAKNRAEVFRREYTGEFIIVGGNCFHGNLPFLK